MSTTSPVQTEPTPTRSGRGKPWLLVWLATATAGFAGVFMKVAIEVREGETLAFDNDLLGWFRDPSTRTGIRGPEWLPEAARDITSLGSYPVLGLLVVLVVVYLLARRRLAPALYLAGSVICGVIVSNLLKIGFNRPRPSFDNTPEVFTASFPSGHATMSAVVFLTLGAILALDEPSHSFKAFLVSAAVLLTVLVGASRVYLGVHYPTDVLAGWSLGMGWSALCLIVARQLIRDR